MFSGGRERVHWERMGSKWNFTKRSLPVYVQLCGKKLLLCYSQISNDINHSAISVKKK